MVAWKLIGPKGVITIVYGSYEKAERVAEDCEVSWVDIVPSI